MSTPQQPADWSKRAMIRDETAPHQIRIQRSLVVPGRLTWSCTCRPITGNYSGVPHRAPLGLITVTIEGVLAQHAEHVRNAPQHRSAS